MPIARERRCLYVTATVLGLFSALVMQMTENDGVPADLYLIDASDFSDVADKLRACGLFRHVDEIKLMKQLNAAKEVADIGARHAAAEKLAQQYPFPRTPDYTDLYLHLDTTASHTVYYGLEKKGLHPDTYLIDEGTASYTRPLTPNNRTLFDHDAHGKNAFYEQLKGVYFYCPEMYVGGCTRVPLYPLTRVNNLPAEKQALMRSLFPVTEQIREKVIFFEGCFHADGLITDEYELLMDIVRHVGRENVIVKRHPRVKIDRYTDRGIKVMAETTVPWEVMLMSQSLAGKLLVSVASFTCMSPLVIYGMEYRTMLLNNLKRGRVYFLEEPGYITFISNLERALNRDRQHIWNPKSLKEMHIQLDRYLAEEGVKPHA